MKSDLKTHAETYAINFDSYYNSRSYNFLISLSELHSTIYKNLWNASSGPDNDHASMLKNPIFFTYSIIISSCKTM